MMTTAKWRFFNFCTYREKLTRIIIIIVKVVRGAADYAIMELVLLDISYVAV